MSQFFFFHFVTAFVTSLCLQAPTVESYLHELAQYAIGILHIATLVPYGRKLTVNATLSNDRLGMAVILDAANGSGYVDPEVWKNTWYYNLNLYQLKSLCSNLSAVLIKMKCC